MGTWELTELPAGRKTIKLKWVFDVKSTGKGEASKHKTRLVAKGFSQTCGIDIHEVFSLVSQYSTIRPIFIAANLQWKCMHIDVKNPIINLMLISRRRITLDQAQGFTAKGKRKLVYRLRKALYSQHEASREWHQRWDKILNEMGFVAREAEATIHSLKRDSCFVFMFA